MTRFDPVLFVQRLIVKKVNVVMYDEVFHRGVNIVRGENSSGKSTVLNFVFYALGGDVVEWSDAALQCDRVFIEVFLSGKVVTLSRVVEEKPGRPMDFFMGSYEESLLADAALWSRHPYRRSINAESFSQVIFRLLGIPEAANDSSGNITVHQMLRLLYADQLSPVESIFRFERFDHAATREAVGELLCGSMGEELYSNIIALRDLEKVFDQVSSEQSSLLRALGTAGHDLTMSWVVEQRARVQDERRDIIEKIDNLVRNFAKNPQAPDLIAQNLAYADLVKAQEDLADLTARRDAVSFEVADSEAFMAALAKKLDALKDSEVTAQTIGAAQFSSCPACYSVVAEAQHGVCPLCKEDADPDRILERLASLINDTALQLRQSKLLQETRLTELAALENAVIDERSRWEVKALKYKETQQRPTSRDEHLIADLNKSLGYLDRRDEDINEKAKLIDIVDALAKRKAELNSEISIIRSRNEVLRLSRVDRLNEAYLCISESVRDLLMDDLKREEAFENPSRVDIDFSANRISVDGKSYFSASSRAILKSSFYIGFHVAATLKKFFRHPRFCLLDTIEDKGMEQARSQNFQRLIVERSERSGVENQVIFSTSMIAEELDIPEYTVGRFYTRDERALREVPRPGGK